jgi:hypothetical protein
MALEVAETMFAEGVCYNGLVCSTWSYTCELGVSLNALIRGLKEYNTSTLFWLASMPALL